MGTPSNYALRLPVSLKKGAEQVAREDGTTLNQFIVSAVAEKLSAMKTAQYFADRAWGGDLQTALDMLSRQGVQPPAEEDRLVVDQRLSAGSRG
ncbi:MAG: pilus assembly protein HicB [Hydrogenophaga sp.]|nr:pilus assembly protein HicB [Hydrogenophaga sp.]